MQADKQKAPFGGRDMGTCGVREAAKELGVTINHMYSLCYLARLDAVKDANGEWAITLESVKRYKKFRQLKAELRPPVSLAK